MYMPKLSTEMYQYNL